jgi:hypothetical protein
MFRVHFWRTRNAGRLGWDLWLLPGAKALLGPNVLTEMIYAILNNRPITPPYGPHDKPDTYDFHASLLRWNRLSGRTPQNNEIQTGDQLIFYWWFTGTARLVETPKGPEEVVNNAWLLAACSIPKKGSGWAGPFGPGMDT